MSLDTLRERLAERLLPPSDWRLEAGPVRSDFDLNPGASRWVEGPLKPAAVLITLVATDDGARVIMTRRADSLARHTGQIAFPGGRLDPGETAVEAALREAWEEVALDLASVTVLGLSDAYETGTGYLVTPVVGWLECVPTLTPSPDEVAEVFEVPWDILMDPAMLRRDHLETPAGVRRWFWSLTHEDRYIWGVTAGIVRALRLRLYGKEGEPALATAEDAA
ncbi:DNA mismatch repair protein MutT [Brevundimonas sp. AAP58]|uniref:NUDIX hydrolase n=1 Tax=Brevundimonas sp. AAP58 TaxID=1523422 RepID=UPI0006B9087A|nr:CoA pyrophosphatase [Brevundimonas sp. AAP58]KPF83798.1 DNA mismatch repair protein MutT [Brevundimonas sp. AAP58]